MQLETLTDSEGEAKELAQEYLDSLNSPAVAFVYVRHATAMRSADSTTLLAKYGTPEQKRKAAQKVAESEPELLATAGNKAPGRIGA